MNEVLGVSSKRLRASTSPPTTRGHQHVIRRILQRKRLMREFFMSDEVSRMLPGKRHSHKNKLKKQKRLVCDTLQNLHACFRNIQPMCTVSNPSFYRMRPFWVVSPNQSDRDTCLCLTHENMALLLAKLNELKVIHTKRSTAILEMVACDISNQSCM